MLKDNNPKDVIKIREKCHLCSSFAKTLHEGKIPLCISCDTKIRKDKGMDIMPNDFYKTFEQIEKEYKEYWDNLDTIRKELNRLKNNCRMRTKHLRKDYCERCGSVTSLHLHHIDYMTDLVETLCRDCHIKAHKEQNFSKSIEEFEKNQRMMSKREKAKEKERIEEGRKAEEKAKIREKERAEEIKKRIKPCFFCSKQTIILKDGVAICQKCSRKVDKRNLRG